MYRSKEEVGEAIDTLLNDLEQIALKDSVISNDEMNILTKVREQCHQLQKQVMQIFTSDLDPAEFQDLFFDTLHDILESVHAVAAADNVITEDEEDLLNRLKNFVTRGIA